MKHIHLLPLLAALSGCATMISGTSQNIAFSVSPSNAQCDLMNKKGEKLAAINAQNNIIHVAKSSDDLTLQCQANGYSTKIAKIESKVNAGAAMVMGLADIGSGAIYKYPETFSLQLDKQ